MWYLRKCQQCTCWFQQDTMGTCILARQKTWRRLIDHNSGNGSSVTNNEHYRPWALFGYMCGFPNSLKRRNLEQLWKRRAMNHTNLSLSQTPAGMMDIAQDLVAYKNRMLPHCQCIQIHLCGSYTEAPTKQNNSSIKLLNST